MDYQSAILLFSTIIAALAFSFIYWRDATKEGFSSDQIFDSIFMIFLGSFLGGKFLFHDLSYDYFRYEFLSAPLILEGMLLGGGLSAYYVTRKYNWDGWKIGDMIAPALVLFQTITFLGIWAATRQIQFIAIALALLSLYMGMQFLKSKKYWGNSSLFFQMKRLNKSIITGGLLAIYLTGSSAIAILFLVTYRNFDSNFWKFQIIFYLLILFVSLILVRRQLSKQKTYMAPKLTKDFLSGIKDKLQKRKSEIQSELETLEKTDPFLQDFRDDGQRFELTDMGDQATDILQRETNDMQEDVLNLELKSINQALTKIEKGTYGIDEKTGKEISKKRLEAYPTATTDIDNE